MSGHPQGHYDDGYVHQGQDAYYQDEHGQAYYDQQDYQHNQHGGDGYYDESYVKLTMEC